MKINHSDMRAYEWSEMETILQSRIINSCSPINSFPKTIFHSSEKVFQTTPHNDEISIIKLPLKW
ncbi:hypothetical protein T4B_8148 [Trichinella pseudospiralis]|uniref:Uncharacterized protein n=2 Tax=Trichinella pseudospiralis TaxID=6337 RepID=A0A0V1KEB3_TRIPS|nr:hypothetical protein T4A_13650 [Trichinella pseudospiralis]KRY93352.1 hypothetical protein T4D_8491 [Trichinella pseudospiralis]KRZ34505.1 hypothetical protein T4B_8148 [Trichinella pseudospiralis]KRZ45157.1 hypothetical protein T4C_11140 [Trichinella pseudospiralis]